MTETTRNRIIFCGKLFAFLLVIYAGAYFFQFSDPLGRPYEIATDIALPVLVGSLVGRKFGIGKGILAGVIVAVVTYVGRLT